MSRKKSNSSSKTLSHAFEWDDGKSETYRRVTLDVTAEGLYDSNYGADADGNRGWGEWFLEDYDYELPEKCDDEILISIEDKKILEAMIEKFVNETDFEWTTEDNNYDEEA